MHDIHDNFQNHPQRNMKRKFHDFLTLLTSTENREIVRES